MCGSVVGSSPASGTRCDNGSIDKIHTRVSSEGEPNDRTPIHDCRSALKSASQTDHPRPDTDMIQRASPAARRLTYSSSPGQNSHLDRSAAAEANFDVDVTRVPPQPMSPDNVLGRSLSNIHIASVETTSGGQDLPASISRSSSGKACASMAVGSIKGADLNSKPYVLCYPSQWVSQ